MKWEINLVEARSAMRPVGNGNERVSDGNGLDGVDRKRSVDKGEEEGTEKDDVEELLKKDFADMNFRISGVRR